MCDMNLAALNEIRSEKKKDLKIGWSLKILHQLISGKHKVNIPVGFNMFCFSQGGARISYPSTVYYICQGGKNQKPWPPTSSINWLHWIPYGSVSKPCTPGEHQNSW